MIGAAQVSGYFNSRPREGANGTGFAVPWPPGQFQFPPPRGGEPEDLLEDTHAMISIPAPARGRTCNDGKHGRYLTISIPAPARGRTVVSCAIALELNFNSRPREGANLRWERPGRNSPDFNSRPREGANLSFVFWFVGWHFNSRPREGANFLHPQFERPVTISIPAPARGRTCVHAFSFGVGHISIPAPARGRTGGHSAATVAGVHFNSRPREGANRPWSA